MAVSFNSVGFALETGEDSIFVDAIAINPRHGIVQGEFAQLTATISPDDVSSRMVEWSSSNENVISCTKEGKIKGVSANGYADITCKAKFGNAKDTIRIYCAESIGGYYKDGLTDLFVLIYDQPGTGVSSTLYFNLSSILESVFSLLRETMKVFPFLSMSPTSDDEVSFGPCEVRGRYGKYAYVSVETQSGTTDGFVKFTKLKKSSSYFLSLSAEDIDVWANGYSYPDCKLTTPYKGSVNWDVADDTIVDFDDKTGQITALKPGRTTITATAGDMKRTCTIHALYRWPQLWTAKANQDTSLYIAKGTGYVVSRDLAAGKNFVVWGDDGSNDGWAYGNIEGTDYWGYVPISHISTKGTISQYDNMTTFLNNKQVPIRWPVYDKTINNISSPYGPRNITASGSIHHRGFDITTGNPGEIAGEYVVASFSGTVKKVYNNTTDCGYSVSISSDCVDPVTGKKISIIYMHLLEKPKYEDGKSVSVGDYIQVGTIIGKVGKSNGNTDPDMGYHLHFEANSQNAAVGDSGRSDFTYTLNPMFFFVNKNVTFSSTNSYKKYGGYWYDLNGGYQNEEIFKSYFVF